MSAIEQNTIYHVVAGMLRDAVPFKKNNKPFGPETLLDDIGMDSLEVLSIAMDLEEYYAVFIPDQEINAFKRVEDIAIYLAEVLAKKVAQPEEAEPEPPEAAAEAEPGEVSANHAG